MPAYLHYNAGKAVLKGQSMRWEVSDGVALRGGINLFPLALGAGERGSVQRTVGVGAVPGGARGVSIRRAGRAAAQVAEPQACRSAGGGPRRRPAAARCVGSSKRPASHRLNAEYEKVTGDSLALATGDCERLFTPVP